jgi:uncharacterized protein
LTLVLNRTHGFAKLSSASSGAGNLCPRSSGYFDCALVHLLTTATLDRLRELYPQGRFEVQRFRPNIVVETAHGERDFVENAWIGQVLAIGDSVRLSVTGPCPRCVMTTLPQADLPQDTGILRTAARHNGANVGIYASVLEGGPLRRGDSVRLCPRPGLRISTF